MFICRTAKRAALAIGLTLLATAAATEERDPKGFNQTGFIQNGAGQNCTYTQTYEQTNPHFMPDNMKHTTHQDLRIIRFDTPDCMANTINDVDIYEPINKMMIADVVARWYLGSYVLEDAAFDTRNRHHPTEYEARGECIQSRTYPSKGIVIEYVTEGDSITSVFYMLAFSGCGDAL